MNKFFFSLVFMSSVIFADTPFLSEPHPAMTRQEINKRITIASVPEWVKLVGFEDAVNEEKSTGTALLLIDNQIKQETGEHYERTVKKLIASREINTHSSISIAFDPHFDKVMIHEVKVIRNGRVLDKLRDAEREIFHQRSGAEDLIYEDTHNVVLYLKDIREGDILDYSYTRTAGLPIYRLSMTLPLGMSKEYCNKITYRYVASKDKQLFFKNHRFMQDPIYIEGDKYQEYAWELYDNEPVTCDENAPLWYDPMPSVQISTVASWVDMANICRDTLLPQFQDPQAELLALVQSWQEESPNKEDQILSAIRFLSNDIRYLSLHKMGSGWQAHDPNEVLARRYGDCKDKAVLLATFLQLLGIDAYPALVYTAGGYETAGYKLKDQLPSPDLDHVIVYMEYNGRSYFIEPGIHRLGGRLDTIHVPEHGYALILKENGPGLIPIPRSLHLPTYKRHATFSVNTARRSAVLNAENHYLYRAADEMRCWFEPGYESKFLKSVIPSLSARFGEVSHLTPPKVEDSIEDSQVTSRGSYSIKNMGKETLENTICYDFKPLATLWPDVTNIDPNRTAPLAVKAEKEEETIDVIFDQPPMGIKESHVKYQDDNFAYAIQWKRISDLHFQVMISYTVFNSWVEPDKVKDFVEKMKEFQEKAKVQAFY